LSPGRQNIFFKFVKPRNEQPQGKPCGCSLKIYPLRADIDIQRLKEEDTLCDIMDMIKGWYSGKNLNLL
jgi:hypothetical protein